MKSPFIIVFITCLLTCISEKIYCQEFIRIYNNSGKKIAKGKWLSSTDSTIELKRGGKNDTIALANVSFIKTKRSAGHSIAIGTGIGVGLGGVTAILGASAESWLGYGSVAVTLPVIGALAGGISAGLRKRVTYEINGDLEKWKLVRAELLGKN